MSIRPLLGSLVGILVMVMALQAVQDLGRPSEMLAHGTHREFPVKASVGGFTITGLLRAARGRQHHQLLLQGEPPRPVTGTALLAQGSGSGSGSEPAAAPEGPRSITTPIESGWISTDPAVEGRGSRSGSEEGGGSKSGQGGEGDEIAAEAEAALEAAEGAEEGGGSGDGAGGDHVVEAVVGQEKGSVSGSGEAETEVEASNVVPGSGLGGEAGAEAAAQGEQGAGSGSGGGNGAGEVGKDRAAARKGSGPGAAVEDGGAAPAEEHGVEVGAEQAEGSGSGEEAEAEGGAVPEGPKCASGPCVSISDSLGNYVISGTLHETLSPGDAERIQSDEAQTTADIEAMNGMMPNITAVERQLEASDDAASSARDEYEDQIRLNRDLRRRMLRIKAMRGPPGPIGPPGAEGAEGSQGVGGPVAMASNGPPGQKGLYGAKGLSARG